MIKDFFHKYHTYIFGIITIFCILGISYFLNNKLNDIESNNVKKIDIIKFENDSLRNIISYHNDTIDKLNYICNDTINELIKKMKKDSSFYFNLYQMNWENICFWVDYYKLKHPDIVKAQILLETNYLKSEACIVNRNLFGMKYVSGRLSIHSYKKFAFYENYVESIMEYKLWQDSYYNGKDNYFIFLKKHGYAPYDKQYTYKLKKIMEMSKRKKNNNFPIL